MGIRILVIEDEDEIADFLVRGLREEGFTVERAADGKDGWFALESGGWDVVLLDWWLPATDGLQLLQRFRQQDQATPVLFLTAKDAVSDRVRGLDNGANDYLCKPFAFEELLARVRALARRQGQTTTIMSYQDVQVDLATQCAERAGQRLDLTAKEQALLVLFLRHPGEVLSRTRIYEQVWDERYDELLNILLDNACKYSEPGTSITMRAGKTEGKVRLIVEDHGYGLDADQLGSLFEPFFRSPEARRRGIDGVGLGLSIAKRLAEVFGGDLTIVSQPQQGSCFTLLFAVQMKPTKSRSLLAKAIK